MLPRIPPSLARHPCLLTTFAALSTRFFSANRAAAQELLYDAYEQGRLIARRLNDYELGVYASRAYLEEHGPIHQRAQLERQRWVGYIEDLMWTSELDYLAEISAAIRPQVRISNVISQVQAVASGLALGVLPCFLAAREPELVRLLPQEIGLRRCYWLLTHADARDLVRVQVVAEFIRERLAARGAAFWLPSLQAGSAG